MNVFMFETLSLLGVLGIIWIVWLALGSCLVFTFWWLVLGQIQKTDYCSFNKELFVPVLSRLKWMLVVYAVFTLATLAISGWFLLKIALT